MTDALVEVKDLVKHFPLRRSLIDAALGTTLTFSQTQMSGAWKLQLLLDGMVGFGPAVIAAAG